MNEQQTGCHLGSSSTNHQPPLLHEIWELVFWNLSTCDLKNVACVCRFFEEEANPYLWAAPVFRTFPERITLAQLAELKNLSSIRQFELSKVSAALHWPLFKATQLVSMIESLIPRFDGLIVDSDAKVDVDALKVLLPHMISLQTHSIASEVTLISPSIFKKNVWDYTKFDNSSKREF